MRGWMHGWVVLTVLVMCCSAVATTLDYQGRITDDGKPYTGTGYFKFVLHDGNGGRLWANNGSPRVSEPAKAVKVDVSEGLFSIVLGDEGAGMLDIPPVALHASKVLLRTWFSSDADGPFERLSPDVTIRALDLAQIDTGDMVVVDEEGGDFSDLQEAVSMVATNPAFRVVLVMPGRYALSAPLRVPAGGRVIIRGAGRDAVQIGNPRGAAVAAFNGSLEGVSLQGSPAVDASGRGAFEMSIRDCVLSGSARGPAVVVGGAGALAVSGCRVVNSDGPAVAAMGNAALRVLFSEVEGDPALALQGSDVTQGAVPTVLQCVLTGVGDGAAVALAGGAAKGDVRLVNSTLVGALGDNVTVVPAGQELPNGNVLLSETQSGE